MNKILVPTDFSELSQQALDFAVDMARYAVAEVQAVHFVQVATEEVTLVTADTAVVGTTEESLYNIQLMRTNKQKLDKIVAKYEESGVTVTAELAGGGFLNGIKHFTKKYDTSMVIMGTSGEQNIEEFFSGNHTEQLIEHLGIPVISMKQPVLYGKVRDIMLAVDLKEQYSPSALRKMKDALLNFNAKIHFVSVIKPDDKDKSSHHKQLELLAQRMHLTEAELHMIEAENVEQALKDYAVKAGAGTIAVLSEAKSGLWRFIQSSLAMHLSKDFDIPIMTLNKRFYE